MYFKTHYLGEIYIVKDSKYQLISGHTGGLLYFAHHLEQQWGPVLSMGPIHIPTARDQQNLWCFGITRGRGTAQTSNGSSTKSPGEN